MYLNGIFINVIMIQGDGIKGCVRKNMDDSYTIVINPAYNWEQQQKTALHELEHILQLDFESNEYDVSALEYYAHRISWANFYIIKSTQGGIKIMGLFDLIKSKRNVSVKREYQENVFHVVGINYYMENIEKLACSNTDYRKSAKTIANSDLVTKKYINTTM